MSTNETQNKETGAEREKQLTPQQIQKRKKMMIFPLFFLGFAGCMWLIFAPDKEKEEQMAGLNTELPTPQESGIVSDKRDAYLQEAMQRKEREKMRSLQDLAFGFDEENLPEQPTEYDEQRKRVSEPPENDKKNLHFEGGGSRKAFQSSSAAYKNINRQLGSFYEKPSSENDTRTEELQNRIKELEHLLEDQDRKSTGAGDEQLALIEKSYQIAARYMNGGQPVEKKVPEVRTTNGKVAVQPVTHVHHNVVSLLAAPISDSVFQVEFAKPRNWGFHTVGTSVGQQERNSIRACVYTNQTLIFGQDEGEQYVPLRLLEPMQAGNILLPRNSVVSGIAKLQAGRIGLQITSIAHNGCIIPVELTVYDTDGQIGINAPGSAETSAMKEAAASVGAGLGSSVSFTQNAGQQVAMDLTKGLMQSGSQYLSKKIRTIKVRLKAGYEVLLLTKELNK